MKGLTRARRFSCAALLLSLATLGFGARLSADVICSAPCAEARQGPERTSTSIAPPALDGLDGGSRTAGWTHAPPRRPVAWSSAMERHDFVVGAVDPDHDDGYAYRLPYGDNESHPVIQGYGAKLSHRGAEQFTVDFGMALGTPVHAARDGLVALVEDSHAAGCWRDDCARLANFIVVLHPDGTTGEYFHLQQGSARVRLGERVRRGQLLARSGNTGYTTAPHLHFGVYRLRSDGRTQSVGVRFLTREGPISEPRAGARYLNSPEG
jgi:murein DD-endopeptidase MepM/ murein hydrolase activator NlpD